MNSTRVVERVNKHRSMIKLVLLLIWGISIWGIYTLLYDRYVLEAYPLRDYLPVLIFTFGNIWLLPGIILWYEKLYPAFDKPEIYYRVKAWSISLKEESFVGMLIFYGIEIFIKLGLFMYGTIIVLAIVIFVSLHLLRF